MPSLMNLTQVSLEPLRASEAWGIIWPVILYVIGMVIYAVFIFKFYRFVAKRDVFSLNLAQYNTASHPAIEKTLRVLLYIIEFLLIFPLFSLFWFIVLTILLSFLADYQTIETLLLVSITLVSSVRVTAYYNENLSQDLSKMLPFALLGIFLLDITNFSFTKSLDLIIQIPSFWRVMAYYLLFMIGLEFLLRLSYALTKPFRKNK